MCIGTAAALLLGLVPVVAGCIGAQPCDVPDDVILLGILAVWVPGAGLLAYLGFYHVAVQVTVRDRHVEWRGLRNRGELNLSHAAIVPGFPVGPTYMKYTLMDQLTGDNIPLWRYLDEDEIATAISDAKHGTG